MLIKLFGKYYRLNVYHRQYILYGSRKFSLFTFSVINNMAPLSSGVLFVPLWFI
jgi:hypothetical protein